jgi:hypothetical protein
MQNHLVRRPDAHAHILYRLVHNQRRVLELHDWEALTRLIWVADEILAAAFLAAAAGGAFGTAPLAAARGALVAAPVVAALLAGRAAVLALAAVSVGRTAIVGATTLCVGRLAASRRAAGSIGLAASILTAAALVGTSAAVRPAALLPGRACAFGRAARGALRITKVVWAQLRSCSGAAGEFGRDADIAGRATHCGIVGADYCI